MPDVYHNTRPVAVAVTSRHLTEGVTSPFFPTKKEEKTNLRQVPQCLHLKNFSTVKPPLHSPVIHLLHGRGEQDGAAREPHVRPLLRRRHREVSAAGVRLLFSHSDAYSFGGWDTELNIVANTARVRLDDYDSCRWVGVWVGIWDQARQHGGQAEPAPDAVGPPGFRAVGL